jgi:hypothetical protein
MGCCAVEQKKAHTSLSENHAYHYEAYLDYPGASADALNANHRPATS